MAFSSLVRSAINRVTDVVQKCTRLFSGNTIQRTQEFEFSQTSVKAYALFVRPALIKKSKKSNFNVHAFTVHSLRQFPKLSSAAFTLKPKDISEKDLKIVRGVWTALNSNQSQTFVRYQICKQALFQNVFANHRLYLHAVAQLYRKYNMRKILNAVAALELKRSNGVIHQDKIGGLVWTGLEYHSLCNGLHVLLGGVDPRLWLWRSKWDTYHIREVELVFDTHLNLVNRIPYDSKHLPSVYCTVEPDTIIWF